MAHPKNPVDSMQRVIDNFRGNPEVAVLGGIESTLLGTCKLLSGHNPAHQLDIFVHPAEPVSDIDRLNDLLTDLLPAGLDPNAIDPFEVLDEGYVQFGRLQFDQQIGTISCKPAVVLHDFTLLSKDPRLTNDDEFEATGTLWQRTRVRLFPSRATAVDAGLDINKYGCFIGGLKRRKDRRPTPYTLLATPLLEGVIRKHI